MANEKTIAQAKECDHKILDWNVWGEMQPETATCQCGMTVDNPNLDFQGLYKIEEKWRESRSITENGVTRMIFSVLRYGGDVEATIRHRLYLDEVSMRRMIRDVKKHLGLDAPEDIEWKPWEYVKYCPLPK